MRKAPKASSPWSSDRDKFLALVFASSLLGLRELAATLEYQDEISDVSQICDHLIALGKLTRWQCDKLLNGQHKGFFLGNFKLLDHPDESVPHYLAEERETQRKVTLLILPNLEWKGGIEYRVID